MPVLKGRITRLGPMIDAKIMLPAARVAALKKAGEQFSQPETISCLIDTGASISAVDSRLIDRLKLGHRGPIRIHTPSTGDDCEYRDTYDVSFVLGEGQSTSLVATVFVIKSEFASQGFFALIGRDILQHCRMRWDGPKRTYELEYEDTNTF